MKSLLRFVFTLATLALPATALAQRAVPEVDVRSQIAMPDDHARSNNIGPTVLDDHGEAPPAGWRRDRWTHANWWIGGSVLMGIGYGLTAVLAVLPCRGAPQCQQGLVPLAGPFLYIANVAGIRTDPVAVTTLLVTDLIQLTGTALIVAGIAAPRRVFVPVLPTLRITPVATAAGNGAEYVVGVGAAW